MARKAKKTNRKRGPVKLTETAQKVIVDSIAAGVPQRFAAQRAGVSERALRYWINGGKKATKGPLFAFFAAIQKAEADAVAARVARIGRSGQGGQVVERKTVTRTDANGATTTTTTEKLCPPTWTADAWMLERTHPDEFGTERRRIKDLEIQLAELIKVIGASHAAGVNRAADSAAHAEGDSPA